MSVFEFNSRSLVRCNLHVWTDGDVIVFRLSDQFFPHVEFVLWPQQASTLRAWAGAQLLMQSEWPSRAQITIETVDGRAYFMLSGTQVFVLISSKHYPGVQNSDADVPRSLLEFLARAGE